MNFTWVPFYEQIADRLLEFSARRGVLYDKVMAAAQDQPLMHYLHFEKQDLWAKRNYEIDPFTVMGIFNRGVTAIHRQELARTVAAILGIKLEPPQSYHGIPYLDPRKSIYDGNMEMWDLFEKAMATGSDFPAAYDAAKDVKGNALGTLSMGLYWMRPMLYMPIDSISGPYMEEHYGLAIPPEKCSGEEYLNYLHELEKKLPKDMAFPAVAHAAWAAKHA